jgi:ABC-2 type transport system ATP-binding protein
MSDLLKISDMNKRFGRKRVLDNFSMRLEEGKVYGLLGKNGEGKTTLIRTILGVIPADGGEIFFKGHKITYRDAAYKKEIGFIPEDAIFYSWMSIAAHLEFNAAFYPRWDAQKAASYLEKFKLDPKSKIRTLSRGMKLKLGFIMALAAQPDLLILDDPTSGLDVPTRHDFLRNVIQEILEGGTTILFSTHLVHEIEGIVDTLGILSDGRLILEEKYDDLKNSIQRVRICGAQSLLNELHIEDTLTKEVDGNVGEWVLYPWTDEKKKEIVSKGPESVEISALDLEEIFLSFVSE